MVDQPSLFAREEEFGLANKIFKDLPPAIQTIQSAVANGTTQNVVQSPDPCAADVSTNSSPLEDSSMQRDQELLKGPHSRYGAGSAFPDDGLSNYDDSPDWANADLDDDPFAVAQSTTTSINFGRSRLSADWLRIIQEGNSRYAFRETDRNNFRGSGWLDADKSGDYNDGLKSARSARPLRNRNNKPVIVEDSDDSDDDIPAPKRHRSRTLNYDQGRKNGRSMLIRLKLSPETIKENEGMPGKFFLSDGAPDDEFMQEGSRDNFRDSGYGGSKSPLKDKTRVITRRAAGHAHDKNYDHAYQNSEDVYESLLGRREARGCRGCYDIRLECSLIDDCLSYPCAHCKEDNQDCILVTPREQKHVCERCKHKRLQCSFKFGDTGDAFATCNHCQEANTICFARPAKSFRIDDVLASTDKKVQISKPESKAQYTTCKKCSKVKLKSFFPPTGQNQTCKICLQSTSSPKAGKVEKKSKAPPKKRVTKTKIHPLSNKASNSHSSRKPTGRQGKASAKQKKVYKKARKSKYGSDSDSDKPKFSTIIPGGKISHITTSFCHPIAFNWVPPPPLSEYYSSQSSQSSLSTSFLATRKTNYPCHFCTNPGLTYALAGLGSKRVEVIQWDYDPLAGYEELEGGWVQAGEESTRMCTLCTMARVLVNICPGHVIRAIKGLDARTFDFESAMEGVLREIIDRGKAVKGKAVEGSGQGDETATKNVEVNWCSVCINPAFYNCCVRPPYTVSGEETDESHDIGCGLLLCEVCAFRMTGMQRAGGAGLGREPVEAVMTLDEHITAAASDSFHYPDGLRADVCFLKADSELMRRCCGQGVAAEDDEMGDRIKEEEMGEQEMEEEFDASEFYE